MSYTCGLNFTPTDYPCAPDCPLFGDCVATYAKYRALCRKEEDKKTVAANIAVKRSEKGACICSKCKTDAALRLVSQADGTSKWEVEPYCAHCGARLIEEGEQK